jgi:hypothetical protein
MTLSLNEAVIDAYNSPQILVTVAAHKSNTFFYKVYFRNAPYKKAVKVDTLLSGEFELTTNKLVEKLAKELPDLYVEIPRTALIKNWMEKPPPPDSSQAAFVNAFLKYVQEQS